MSVVGSDRSGKSSTVRSIMGEKIDPVSDSTKGLNVTEADAAELRKLGLDKRDVNVAFDEQKGEKDGLMQREKS